MKKDNLEFVKIRSKTVFIVLKIKGALGSLIKKI